MISISLSIILPVLDEEEAIEGTLSELRALGAGELIVVDGGSRDATVARARPLADVVIESRRGRGPQMNAGAAVAKGDVLLFLHADTRLPRGFAAAIERSLTDPAVVGGRFDLELDEPGLAYRLLAAMIRWRSRATRLATGDQAIFVRRAVFAELGGYPDVPIFEDLELSLALRRRGPVACLTERVVTSARRWRHRGFGRTVVLMWTLRGLWALGVSPATLARFYANVR